MRSVVTISCISFFWLCNNGTLGEKMFMFTWQFWQGFLVHLKYLAVFRGQKSLGTTGLGHRP